MQAYRYCNCVEWMKRDLNTKQASAYVSREYTLYSSTYPYRVSVNIFTDKPYFDLV